MSDPAPRPPANVLRPSAGEAFAAWTALVEANREQIERLRESVPDEDFYQPRARQFRPGRAESAELPLLLEQARPNEDWLDIGAGGGRFAIPLAAHVHRVIAVEPSPAMREVLEGSAAEAGVSNIELHDLRWPDGANSVPPADVSLAAHMLYDQPDLRAFLEAMEAHTRRLCVVLIGDRAPSSTLDPIWTELYGERARLLPARPELLSALGAWDRAFDVRTVPLPEAEPVDEEAAMARARFLFWLQEGSEREQRAHQLIREQFATADGQIAFPARLRSVSVITWTPPQET
jgi:FkbM family methyltransferase